MKLTPSSFILLLLFLFAGFTACVKEDPTQPSEQNPFPQATSTNCVDPVTNSCASLGYNSMGMISWAPFIKSKLNECWREPSTCTPTSATMEKTKLYCWAADAGPYDGGGAGFQVCQVRDWARNNRPSVTTTANLAIFKWRIIDYDYYYDANHNCNIPGCTSTHSFFADITYQKFRCDLVVEHAPHELKFVRFSIIGGPIKANSDGLVEMVTQLEDLPPGGNGTIKATIKAPDGEVIEEVLSTPTADPDSDDQVLQFEVGYPLETCSFIFERM